MFFWIRSRSASDLLQSLAPASVTGLRLLRLWAKMSLVVDASSAPLHRLVKYIPVDCDREQWDLSILLMIWWLLAPVGNWPLVHAIREQDILNLHHILPVQDNKPLSYRRILVLSHSLRREEVYISGLVLWLFGQAPESRSSFATRGFWFPRAAMCRGVESSLSLAFGSAQ